MRNSIFKLEFQITLILLVYTFIISLFLNSRLEDYHIYSFVVIFSVFLIAYWFYITHYQSSKFIYYLLIISTTLKIAFVFITAAFLNEFHGMPFLSYNDDFIYNETALSILNAWNTRGIGFYNDIYFSTGFYSGYPNISALGMWLFGESLYVPRLLNVFFSTATVYYFYKSLSIENNWFPVRLITTFFAFSLTFILYASFQLKDTILVFLLSVIIYNAGLLIKRGATLNVTIWLIASSVLIIFFRAATLLTIASALVISFFVTQKTRTFSLKNSSMLVLFLVGFVFIWDYFNSIDLLVYDSVGYIGSRFDNVGTTESLSGSNSLSSLGFIGVILGPLYMVFSIFLPTPLAVNLDPHLATLNYHFIPTIQYYSILPISILGMVLVFKNRKVYKFGVLILLFIVMYKLGQASSKSIFDSRQSLPAIYGLYLIAGYAVNSFPVKLYKNKKNRLIITISLITMMIVLFAFSFIRLNIRAGI